MLQELGQQLGHIRIPPDRLAERYRPLEQNKRACIDYACGELGIRSFLDLAGGWCDPPGGYSLYAIEKYQVPTVYLIDMYMPDELVAEAQNHPGLHLFQASIASTEIAAQIPPVDAVLLFDILLHCVRPDWDEVLEMYADRTNWFFVSNIMYPNFDHTVRLFDLGEQEYFDSVPNNYRDEPDWVGLFERLDQPVPSYATRTYRDWTFYYQWGITDNDLINKMKQLGFELCLYKNMFRRSEIKKNPWSRLFGFMRSGIQ
jgi:hypothetical protein